MASISGQLIGRPLRTINESSYLCQSNTKLFLHLMLSTKTYLTTSEQTSSTEDSETKQYDQIGVGECGTVWDIRSTNQVIKIMNEGKKEQLWNDCCMHKRVEEAFQQLPQSIRADINIPCWGAWVNPASKTFWYDYGDGLPASVDRSWGFLSTRIGAVPPPVCQALLKEFGTKSKKFTESILSQSENKDCLVRLYLGRRLERDPYRKFKLRNFDLMINEMETLELDTKVYARIMARTLAALHWKARVDAGGVEFVIGQAPQFKQTVSYEQFEALDPDHSSFTNSNVDLHQRSLAIWLLDFDQCKSFPESDEGVWQLKKAFFSNDPYYPQPGSHHPDDVALWHIFREVYLQTSAALTDSELPQHFIDAIDVEGKRRADGF